MAGFTKQEVTADQFFGIVPIDEDLAPVDTTNPEQELKQEIESVEGKRPSYIYEMWAEREGENKP